MSSENKVTIDDFILRLLALKSMIHKALETVLFLKRIPYDVPGSIPLRDVFVAWPPSLSSSQFSVSTVTYLIEIPFYFHILG